MGRNMTRGSMSAIGRWSGSAVRGASHFPAPLPPRASAPLLFPRGSRLRVPDPMSVRRGFTLIEILIVISIIGILVTLAQPSFHRAVTAAREATLKENLFVLRDVIDQFYADNGKYPAALADLVEKGYIRRLPKDPVTGSEATWVLVPATDEQGQQVGIYDVKSGSDAISSDGTKYSDW
jgi:general secretion pathway protein G